MDGLNRRDFLVSGLVLGSLSAASSRQASAAQPPTASSARSIELLVFDTFGTVVDWRSSVIAEGEQLGPAKGLRVDWAASAASTFHPIT